MLEGENQPVGEQGLPAAIIPVVTPAAKPEPPVAKADPPAAPEAPKAAAIGEDGEVPDDAALLQLSPKALAARLNRHTKRELMTRFGSDDPVKIKADLDELNTFRTQRDEQRRATLSEIERAKEDATKEKARADDAEAKLQKQIDQSAYGEYDRTAEKVLAQYVDPEALELAVGKLKKHVLSLDEEDLAKPDKVFDEWAKDWAKKNPRYAKASDADETPVRQVKLSTGTSPNAKQDGANRQADAATKTARPGNVGTMTKTEYAAYKRQRGFS